MRYVTLTQLEAEALLQAAQSASLATGRDRAAFWRAVGKIQAARNHHAEPEHARPSDA